MNMKKVAKFIQARSEILDLSSGSLSHVIGLTKYKDIDAFRNIVAEWYQKKNHNFGQGEWIKELKEFAHDKKIKFNDTESHVTLDYSDVQKLLKKHEVKKEEDKPKQNYWAIVKNKKVMTSGSMRDETIEYLRDLAKKYSGELVFNDKSFSKPIVNENEPLYFGMTWDELNRKQHRE